MRIALMVASLSAYAALAEAGNAESFHELTRNSWIECSWRANVASMPFAGADGLDHTSHCVERATTQAEEVYRAAPEGLQSILKPYYLTWRTKMESLASVPETSRTVAERLIGESSMQLDDAWGQAETALRSPSPDAGGLATAIVDTETPTSAVDASTAGNL
jgi:hypothetical protein